MTDFVPGLRLCEAFYRDVVAPALSVPHAAALLGAGSDVLGYDTPRSTDHDWGPRCQVFVAEEHISEARAVIARRLPKEYAGWPLAIGRDGATPGHQVVVDALPRWIDAQLGWQLDRPLTIVDWLVIPQARLLGLTRGAVLADPDGELAGLRKELAWYPEPVWWWLLACQWRRLAQEEPFVQRTAEVSDVLGSQLVVARLTRDCMRLALLMAREYAPYVKWLGTAFDRLSDPDGLAGTLAASMTAASALDRQQALGKAYQLLAARFNGLAADLEVDTGLRPFHDRPAVVLGADRFADAAIARVGDAQLRELPLIGSVDQLVDSTDLLARSDLAAQLRPFYAGLLAGRPDR